MKQGEAIDSKHQGTALSLVRVVTAPFVWLARSLLWFMKLTWTVICLPFVILRFIRSVVTPASVTLILMGIITLNIIWGYPWTGIFASCLMLMAGGFLVSRLFRPLIKVELSAPASVPAGQSFRVTTHVFNAGRFPTLDAWLRLRNLRDSPAIECQDSQPIPVLYPQQRCQLGFGLHAKQRGVHRLPYAYITSSFPFSLFESHRVVSTDETIAITPRPLAAEDDEISCQLVIELGNWTRKLLTGDSMEYTGSREYQTGMSVRRWDFASWARLGRPIVREFSSSAVQEVTLLVDTSHSRTTREKGKTSARKNRFSLDVDLERLLSAAASALTQLTTRGVEVRLVITGEPTQPNQEIGQPTMATRELQPLLVRLAPAARVSVEQASQAIERSIAESGSRAMLILTTRSEPDEEITLGNAISVLRVGTQTRIDPAHPVLGSMSSATRHAPVRTPDVREATHVG